ncbi:MAG: DNA polymerase III subunit delta, partial [Gammaproteobacteria bacterium]|nr:DNA polymerase III subunit delta [Gammaproteobacteria bacterium]
SAPQGGSLSACYLFSGDEPLLVNEALDALRAAALRQGCDERESFTADRSFNWAALTGSLGMGSLFSAGKLVVIRLPTAAPGDEGSRALRELAARPADGNVVVVVTPALSRKIAESAWVGALQKGGVSVEFRGPSPSGLPRWIGQRLKSAGLRCEHEAAELLAARVEGNLLAAQQEIDKLGLLYPAGTELTVAQVQAAVADGARFDVSKLGDAALAGDTVRAVRILNGLRAEGVAAPLVLWALVREVLVLVDAGMRAGPDLPLERAVQATGAWKSRVDLYTRALRGRKPSSLRRLLAMAGTADKVVKGARRGEAWNALLELTLALTGKPLPAAELP